jgi:hypothetical protein
MQISTTAYRTPTPRIVTMKKRICGLHSLDVPPALVEAENYSLQSRTGILWDKYY